MLRDGLTDGWLVLPDIGIRSDRDYQLDVVLVHAEWGVVLVEVKGHRVSIREGYWCDGRGPLDPQPTQQARSNAYALRERLRALPGFEHINVEYGVALPNTVDLVGGLPLDTARQQILTATDLEDPAFAVEELLFSRSWSQRLPEGSIEEIVRLLRPGAEVRWDPEALATAARRRLEQICTNQVGALESLDANRRVFVTGRAGTGKTRLAIGWVRRAYRREERVLFTCYNDPLGERVATLLPDDPAIVAGAFFRIALGLPGMPALEVPETADHEWCNTVAIDHLEAHWDAVSDRFETIVVDEGQDFSPSWLSLLERLLASGGRLLVVADDAQDLYDRGSQPPSNDEGWTLAALDTNCRNAHPIARILRRHLDGARAPMVGPEGLGVRFIDATDLDVATEAVRAELGRLLAAEQRSADHVLVATVASEVRNALRARLGLARWEERHAGGVVCENVHRIKGLEADTVVLVALDPEVADPLLYVGLSRAVSELVVIGAPEVGARLGMNT